MCRFAMHRASPMSRGSVGGGLRSRRSQSASRTPATRLLLSSLGHVERTHPALEERAHLRVGEESAVLGLGGGRAATDGDWGDGGLLSGFGRGRSASSGEAVGEVGVVVEVGTGPRGPRGPKGTNEMGGVGMVMGIGSWGCGGVEVAVGRGRAGWRAGWACLMGVLDGAAGCCRGRGKGNRVPLLIQSFETARCPRKSEGGHAFSSRGRADARRGCPVARPPSNRWRTMRSPDLPWPMSIASISSAATAFAGRNPAKPRRGGAVGVEVEEADSVHL